MPKITLRVACEADADAMLQVYTPYVTSTRASWEYEPPALTVFAGRVREYLDAGFPWLLAEENGTVLGYAYAGRLGERRGYDWDAEATVYLSAAAHRRHIGTALYTALLALLRAQGYVNCYALITDPNPASEAFHRRMGFAEAARLPGAGYKQGQWIGLFYFHKLLCTPPAQPANPVPLCALDGARVAEILENAAGICAKMRSAACGYTSPKPANIVQRRTEAKSFFPAPDSDSAPACGLCAKSTSPSSKNEHTALSKTASLCTREGTAR